MNVHTASLINALVLICISAWGYLASDTPSITALIPAVFGVLLVACFPGVKSHNKVVAHIAVVLTLVVMVALFKPLKGALGREDLLAVSRVTLMIASCGWAMFHFVRSFIEARRKA